MSDKRAEILAWLAEQEALCADATAGPWMSDAEDWLPGQGPDRGAFVITPAAKDSRHYVIAGRPEIDHRARESRANGRLIAAARTVLPLALAALRAEIEAHETYNECLRLGEFQLSCKACDCSAPCFTIERIHAATVGAYQPVTAVGSSSAHSTCME